MIHQGRSSGIRRATDEFSQFESSV